MSARSNKSIVTELLEVGFGQADRSVFERLVADDYIQHNPWMQTGRAGLIPLLDQLRALPDNVFRPLRMLQDDALVLVHSEWRPSGQRRAVFDLFRVEAGLLVEHWDAIQEQPVTTASGRTLLDGPTAVEDPERTAINKALIAEFVTTVLVRGRLEQLPSFFAGDRCAQHSPGVADGVSALRAHLSGSGSHGGAPRYSRLHRLMGEGNFVFTLSEGEVGGARVGFYDLFRVEAGKIAEHWNITQPVPDRMAHGNGMF